MIDAGHIGQTTKGSHPLDGRSHRVRERAGARCGKGHGLDKVKVHDTGRIRRGDLRCRDEGLPTHRSDRLNHKRQLSGHHITGGCCRRARGQVAFCPTGLIVSRQGKGFPVFGRRVDQAGERRDPARRSRGILGKLTGTRVAQGDRVSEVRVEYARTVQGPYRRLGGQLRTTD